jgi:glutamate racemase
LNVTIIDSGSGGISFCRNVSKEINYLTFDLLIDKDGFPYGNKELLWLKERLLHLVEEAKSDTVIIACNTLSSLIFYFNLEFSKRVVDVITPTIYFLLSQNFNHICILATKNTIKMKAFDLLVDKDIYYLDATDLIKDIEYNNNFSNSLNELIKQIPSSCDCLVLGCTHLIVLKEEFRKRVNIFIVSQDELFIKLFNIEKTSQKND